MSCCEFSKAVATESKPEILLNRRKITQMGLLVTQVHEEQDVPAASTFRDVGRDKNEF